MRCAWTSGLTGRAAGTARLADFPENDLTRPEIGAGAHRVMIGNYLVLYRVERDSVGSVRIIHGARAIGGLVDG